MEKKETYYGEVASVLNRLSLKHNKLAGKLRVRSKQVTCKVIITGDQQLGPRGDGLGREMHEDRAPRGWHIQGDRRTPGPQRAQGDGGESWTLRHTRKFQKEGVTRSVKGRVKQEFLRHVATGQFYFCHSGCTGAVTLSLARRGWRKKMCTQLRLWVRGQEELQDTGDSRRIRLFRQFTRNVL